MRARSSISSAPSNVAAHAFWFGEDQGRYVVTVDPAKLDEVVHGFAHAHVPIYRLGTTRGDALTLPGERPILVSALAESFEGWLPAYMAAGAP